LKFFSDKTGTIGARLHFNY